MVHGIVKRHGGAVHVQSGIDGGTTFTILMPGNEAPCRPQAPVVSLAPTGRGHILVVDDEPMVADVCQKMVEHLVYRATVFTDSLAALAAFRNDPA